MTASEVNYGALRELISADEEDKASRILQGSQGEDEERMHFIRMPVEIKEFIQRVTKELQQETLGLEQIGCYREIEHKQIEQQQHQ